MDIGPYQPQDLEQMLALYNAETAFEPYIAPLTPQRFVELVEQKSYFDANGLLVARHRGDVVGWVHACVAPGSEPYHDPDVKVPRIRMLIFPKEQLRVGQQLVSEAVKWLQQTGHQQLLAFHAQAGYPFYRGLWCGGEPMAPVTMPHVQMALEVGGFKSTQESIFITLALDGPPSYIGAQVDVKFDEHSAVMEHSAMRESWIGFRPMRTRATIRDEQVGSIGWVIQPHLDRLGAPCMNIWGLGVREAFRRQGIATALISRALASAYDRGARFASVGTQLWNAPAHATYLKMGFRPHLILVGRTLEIKQDDRH